MSLFTSANAFSLQIMIAGMVCSSTLTMVLEETIFLPTNWLSINQLFTQKRLKSMIAVMNSMSFQEFLSIASLKFFLWYVSVNIRNVLRTLLHVFNISNRVKIWQKVLRLSLYTYSLTFQLSMFIDIHPNLQFSGKEPFILSCSKKKKVYYACALTY